MNKTYNIHCRIKGYEYKDNDITGTILNVQADDESIHDIYADLYNAVENNEPVVIGSKSLYLTSIGKYYEK